ncbi:srg family chemoreceptor domain-containing protein [Ditylenchus destructor]|uniref:Serpentine receptor class gamma n=1 Tax=Ditylenchus destructor TaxID=166010 RepID=A0AAD4MS55_9BILA|nr:srg family chemoreceptor domain-containing protein [Ditylenchus destructor]
MGSNESSNIGEAIFAFLAEHLHFLYNPPLSAVIPLPYAIPTIALDIFINCIVIQHFKTPFYRLYTFFSVARCLAWFSYFYMYRASSTHFFYPIYELIPQNGWIPAFLVFFFYYVIYVKYFLEFTLTLNRFTVLAFPLAYVKLWKKIMLYIILIALLYPFLLTWHILYYGATSALLPTGYYLASMSRSNNSFNYMAVNVVYGLSVALMNIYICIKLFLRRKRNANVTTLTNNQGAEIELNLILFTCYLFIFALLVALCEVQFSE